MHGKYSPILVLLLMVAQSFNGRCQSRAQLSTKNATLPGIPTDHSSRIVYPVARSPQRVEYNEDDSGDIAWACPPHIDYNNPNKTTIRWFKLSRTQRPVDLGRGNTESRSNILHIKDAGSKDEGRYVCVVQDTVGVAGAGPTTMHFYQFIILETLRATVGSSSHVNVYFNQKLILDCPDGGLVRTVGGDTEEYKNNVTIIDRYPTTRQESYNCNESARITTIKLPATLSHNNCSLSLHGCPSDKEISKGSIGKCMSMTMTSKVSRGTQICAGPISIRYYYDNTMVMCLPFESGLCGPDPYSFPTLKDCEETCRDFSKDDCFANLSTVACDDREVNWHLSNVTRECVIGCVDGARTFRTETECRAVCGTFLAPSDTLTGVSRSSTDLDTDGVPDGPKSSKGHPRITRHVVNGSYWRSTKQPKGPLDTVTTYNVSDRMLDYDPCYGNALVGSCDYGAHKPTYSLARYSFSAAKGLCLRTLYSGCRPDVNLFDDSNDCKSSCEYRLYNSLVSGRCKSPYSINCVDTTIAVNSTDRIRYHFSPTEHKCIAFQCVNSQSCTNQFFQYEDECNQFCRPKRASEELLRNKCFAKVIVEQRSCLPNERVHVWFYMRSISQCLQYSTCPVQFGGNLFLTKAECEDSCLSRNIYTVCSLPPDQGLGLEVRMMFYFDSGRSKCSILPYKGSLGNLNRFKTFEECSEVCAQVMSEVTGTRSSKASALISESKSSSIGIVAQGPLTNYSSIRLGSDYTEYCYDAPKYGTCAIIDPRAYVTKYFYNGHKKTCQPYQFWGCGATSRNSFDSYYICSEMCTRRMLGMKSSLCSRKTSWCSNSTWIYWRYNDVRGGCELFPSCVRLSSTEDQVFPTEDSCTRQCVPRPPLRKELFDVCHLPPTTTTKSELCLSPIKRWFYNSDGNTCTSSFSCVSYGNNFPTESACLDACAPHSLGATCEASADKGPCQGNRTMFYFDRDSHRCTTFTYGGCLGNRNRFQSVGDCRAMCRDMSGSSVLGVLVPLVMSCLIASVLSIHQVSAAT